MIEQDTIKLLRECDAGIKMGVSSIDDVLGYVKLKIQKTSTKNLIWICKSCYVNITTTEKSRIQWQKVCRGLKPI